MATATDEACNECPCPPRRTLKYEVDPGARSDWCDKPGFWDPHAVTEICIPIISRVVYSATKTICAEKPSLEAPCGTRVCGADICRGLTMYTKPWETEACIDKVIQRYIHFPCKMELTECINLRPERALATLLAYLRYRGPFFAWPFRGKEMGVAFGRYLPANAMSYMTHLPELDMSACIAIGRHLSHLLRIAYGHRMPNMRIILAKVWGPLFLKVEVPDDLRKSVCLTQPQKVEAAIEIFSRMLEYVPWHTMTPFQNVSYALAAEKSRYLTSANRQRDQGVQDLLSEPNASPGVAGRSLCEIMHEDATRVACDTQQRDQEAQLVLMCNPCAKTCEFVKKECVSYDPRYIADTVFPPDNCSLSFGCQTSLPSQDKT